MRCVCNHELGVHIPDPLRPFAWPCRLCGCREYREALDPFGVIYTLSFDFSEYLMPFVSVYRDIQGRWVVIEGLTNA